MSQVYESLSLANHTRQIDAIQKLGLAIGGVGVLLLFVAWAGIGLSSPGLLLSASIGLMTVGTFVYAWRSYMTVPEGIKNNGVWFDRLSNRGVIGWLFGIIITGFYVLLYFFPALLGHGTDGAANTGIVALFDPLSKLLNGKPSSQWFVYGTLYTVAIVLLGFKFILKYRHNKYQLWRTISVMFFQLAFAFMLPELLEGLNSDQPYFQKDLKNMWPLNFYFFQDWNVNGMLGGGSFGMFMLFWGLALTFIISPILTFFYGKRWYCSWVCGCGGLAETAGDPYRQLSDKSVKAWKVERWLIHSILLLVTIVTVAIIYAYIKGDPDHKIWLTPMSFVIIVVVLCAIVAAILLMNKTEVLDSLSKNAFYGLLVALAGIAILSVVAILTSGYNIFFIPTDQLKTWYGFLVGSVFSGVIGVGFYPILGSRVWCRFGCPMAALLGLQQKFFSRFRITTNGGQCISCGNCSTYCEMGIDVRHYAQRGQNVVRASCVGCGICAAVCPRGVLRLENGSVDLDDRVSELKALHIGSDGVALIK